MLHSQITTANLPVNTDTACCIRASQRDNTLQKTWPACHPTPTAFIKNRQIYTNLRTQTWYIAV